MSSLPKNELLDSVLKQIRGCLFTSGAGGCKQIEKAFKYANEFHGDGRLDRRELEGCLAYCGVFTTDQELSVLVNNFGDEGSGVNFNELVAALQQPLAGRRLNVVNSAWDQATGGQDSASVETIMSRMNPSNHPFVKEGRKPAKHVYLEVEVPLMEMADQSGCVSREQFLEVYANLSNAIPADAFFVELLEGCWGAAEEGAGGQVGQIVQQQQQEREQLISQLRLKLSVKGSIAMTPEKQLRSALQFFNASEDGRIVPSEFKNAMTRFGFHLTPSQLDDFFNLLDTDQNGWLDSEEFIRMVAPPEKVRDFMDGSDSKSAFV